jgi:hypothetical protein
MPVIISSTTALLPAFGMPASIGGVLLKFNDAELMLNTAYEDEKRPPSPDPLRIKHLDDTAICFGCSDVDGT